jgi:hypothetical protein
VGTDGRRLELDGDVPARAATGGSGIQLSLNALSLAEVSFRIGRGVDGGPRVETMELSRRREAVPLP